MAAVDQAGAQQMRERVLREARALARLQHPNVVIIHHIVDTPEYFYPWLVMELVSGGSLADRLAHGPLSVPEAARIGRGVLSALRAAHATGVQHRDVKPGNVLLRADGTPVLTDFGIAALHDATALTATGALIGSPEYMAPERIRGVEGNPASDLWSLGMMLYVALEGDHPLRRASTLATLAAVLDEPLPPPARSGRLGPLLFALLAKDPAARPDADQLDHMLAAAESQAGGHAGGQAPVVPGGWTPAYHDTRQLGLRTPGPPPPVGPPGSTGQNGWAQPPNGPTRPAAPIRRRGAGMAVLSVAVVVLAGTLAWRLIPGGGQAANHAGSSTSPGISATGTTSGSAPTLAAVDPTASLSTATDLLTPAGVRATIKAMRPYLGGDKVKELVIYPGYASAEAPTPADPKLYDDVDYRDGGVTHSPGGTMSSDDGTVTLQGFDWDVLPALLAKAQKTLNVPHPTSRYIIIEPDLFSGGPTIDVYLSDAYGSGYLSSDPKGKILSTYPRGS